MKLRAVIFALQSLLIASLAFANPTLIPFFGGSTVNAIANSPFGTGADGNLTLSSTFNLNNNASGSRAYADGITYQVTSTPTGAKIQIGQTPNGFSVNDRALLINLAGTSGDSANVGSYELVAIKAVNATSLSLYANIKNSYGGTTFSNQKIILQRVPQYRNVTLNSGGTITAKSWDGLATAPSGIAGYQSGIVAFFVNQSLTVNTGGMISASSIGFRGGVTTSTGPEALSGFQTTGGGGGGGGSGGHAAAGGTGANGASAGTYNPTGSVQGGGAGSGCGGGGGAGGGWGSNLGGSASSGGGAGGTQLGNNGVVGSNATSVGGGGGGAAAGRDSAGGGGGGCSMAALTNSSSAALTTLIFGGGAVQGAGGGGGGGQGDNVNAVGGSGGDKIGTGGAKGTDSCTNTAVKGTNGTSGQAGGGMIYILARQLTNSGQIIANGGTGGAGGAGAISSTTSCVTSNPAGGGGGGGGGSGGAGGTIRIQTYQATLGTITATGGTGGGSGAGGATGVAGGNGYAGNTGASGVIGIFYKSSISGTTTPSAYSQKTQ